MKGPGHWRASVHWSGDVLASQAKTKEALSKYDAALKFAPNCQSCRSRVSAVSRVAVPV
jgi:predicted negative regulator of RcsB-dependent stress response